MARKRRASLIFLDTHIVCWLYEGRLELLSEAGRSAIESSPLRLSPMAKLELQYLYEIGRINRAADEVFAALAREIDLRLNDAPFSEIVKCAQTLAWTRDPFDRLIVAETLVAEGMLVTRDEKIRANSPCALW